MKTLSHIPFQRAVNTLMGLHIGDSLGATIEFEPPRAIGNFHREITGQGPFNWEAGDPTDDSQLMILLLQSLNQLEEFSQDDYAQKLISWMLSQPKDIGTTTKASILRLQQGEPFHLAGVRGEDNQSNGSLMRCAPLALYYQGQSLTKVAKLQAELTHAHINCLIADEFFLQLLSQALLTSNQDRQALITKHLLTLQAHHSAFYQQLAFDPSCSWESLESSGNIFNTLRLVLWLVWNHSSFSDVVIWGVNRGGDSDTVGAIAGALSGALQDEPLPSQWLAKIKGAKSILELLSKN